MKKSEIFWQTYLNLEKEAVELSKYIFFTDVIEKNEKGKLIIQNCDTQLGTFSSYIADLLVRCCVEIEAISKELYHENGGSKPRGDSDIHFDEDCLKLIDIKWQTHMKTVMVVAPSFNFTKDENHILRPLKKAHRTQGMYWEKAYQAVKHDRYYSLLYGNVKAFLHALAALYLLNLYYRNDSWITSYQDISKHDYSMGSSIFAVRPPIADQLWYGNQARDSESPYVVTYNAEDYKHIEEIQQRENQALQEYWSSQPELQESAFMAQLQEAYTRSPRVMHLWELGKYRLNKKLPGTLPFEERKKGLIDSEEWNGWIHQNNEHRSAAEITEENIQEEIDSVGKQWGMELEKQFQRFEWLPIAVEKDICKIYIPS